MPDVCRLCGRPTIRSKSLCLAHSQRKQRGYPAMDAPLRGWSRGVRACSDCGKESKVLTKGLCSTCYYKAWREAKKEKKDVGKEA